MSTLREIVRSIDRQARNPTRGGVRLSCPDGETILVLLRELAQRRAEMLRLADLAEGERIARADQALRLLERAET